MTELIIKYYGDISRVADIAVNVTLLLCGYAIIEIEEEKIQELTRMDEVIYIEYPRRIYEEQYGDYVMCQNPIQNNLGMYGEGTIVAIIDTGVETDNQVFGNRVVKKNENSEVKSYEHGTAVASIAAGEFENGGGLATKAQIISLAINNSLEGSFYKTSEVMKAIDIAVKYALEIEKPLVINISFGNSYGPHDGTGLFERYIDCVASIGRVNIVVGMGNEGATGTHFFGKFNSNNNVIKYYDFSQSIDILVSVGEYESEMILSLWKNFGDDIAVEIILPNGKSTGVIYEEDFLNNVVSYSIDGNYGFVRFQAATPYTSKSEIYIEMKNISEYLPYGIYVLRVTPGNIKYGEFDIWIPIASRNISFIRPDNTRNTLTVPATAARVISVGAYDARTEQYAAFSGRGYILFSNSKPDIVANGVMVPAIVAGTNNIAGFTGTSFSTPIITGIIAMLMGWGIVEGNDRELYGEKMRAYLRKAAIQLRGENTPSVKTGYGAICLGDVFS